MSEPCAPMRGLIISITSRGVLGSAWELTSHLLSLRTPDLVKERDSKSQSLGSQRGRAARGGEQSGTVCPHPSPLGAPTSFHH